MTEEPEVYDALLVFPGEVPAKHSGVTWEALGYWGHSGRKGYEEGQGEQEQQLAAGAGAAGREQQQAQEQEGAAAASSPLRSLSRVVVSMNHTDVPPTQVSGVGTRGPEGCGRGTLPHMGGRAAQQRSAVTRKAPHSLVGGSTATLPHSFCTHFAVEIYPADSSLHKGACPVSVAHLQLILDQFEVVPTWGNGLALYKRWANVLR